MDMYYKIKSKKDQFNLKYLFTINGLTRNTKMFLPLYHMLLSRKNQEA